MPTDSNGNYTLPPSYFVQNGDTILPVQHNPPLEDVADALSARLMRDGRASMSGDLNMGGNRITGLADPIANQDAVTIAHLLGLGLGTVGSGVPLLADFHDTSVPNGFYRWEGSSQNAPGSSGGGAVKFTRSSNAAAWLASSSYGGSGNNEPTFYIKSTSGTGSNDWGPWRTLRHSGDTRTDSENDALFVPQARTISAGDGLSGGGNLVANRSLAVDGTVIRNSGNQSISGTLSATGFSGAHSGNGSGLTSLNGSNISSGTVAAARVGDLPASKIASGTLGTARIPGLPASKITSGVFDSALIPPLSAGQVPSLDASKITTGTFLDARIPSLNASKINAGTFSTARIPNLPASKITSGTFNSDRIPSLNASKITAGTFHTNRIPSLDAGKVTTGVFNSARIPTLSAGQVPDLDAGKITTGTFANARIPNLPAGQITSGTFSTNRIPNLPADQITSGTFSTARIPSLPASQITSGVLPLERGGTGETTQQGMRGVSESTTNTTTALPVGSTVLVSEFGTNPNVSSETDRNASETVRRPGSAEYRLDAGEPMLGTWRARGSRRMQITSGDTGNWLLITLFQRVA